MGVEAGNQPYCSDSAYCCIMHVHLAANAEYGRHMQVRFSAFLYQYRQKANGTCV